jgi:hypothetical protein
MARYGFLFDKANSLLYGGVETLPDCRIIAALRWTPSANARKQGGANGVTDRTCLVALCGFFIPHENGIAQYGGVETLSDCRQARHQVGRRVREHNRRVEPMA